MDKKIKKFFKKKELELTRAELEQELINIEFQLKNSKLRKKAQKRAERRRDEIIEDLALIKRLLKRLKN